MVPKYLPIAKAYITHDRRVLKVTIRPLKFKKAKIFNVRLTDEIDSPWPRVCICIINEYLHKSTFVYLPTFIYLRLSTYVYLPTSIYLRLPTYINIPTYLYQHTYLCLPTNVCQTTIIYLPTSSYLPA